MTIVETSPGVFERLSDTDPIPPEEEIADRILFAGIQGGFGFAGLGGFTIRFALSELGPLGVFVSIELPSGIVVNPHTGLTIGDFAGGVEFFKTLPSIEDPLLLRDPIFDVGSSVTAATWLAEVQDQVFNQFLQIQANPNLAGFFAASGAAVPPADR